jgi:hypothetical protein
MFASTPSRQLELARDIRAADVAAANAAPGRRASVRRPGPQRSPRLLMLLAALAASAIAAAVLPLGPVALAADNATIDATVTPATPCITIDQTSIDFGTPPFSTTSGESVATAAPPVTVTNCGANDEQLLASGTGADSGDPNSPAHWNLVPQSVDCASTAPDTFAIDVPLGTNGVVFLSTNPAAIQAVAGNGGTASIDHEIHMPCSGSSGVGQVMSMQILYTVTF